MPSPVVGMIGASVGGSVMQASAANKAAKAQKDAANQQIALQREIYEDTSAKFQPFLEGGTNAFNALLSEMGLADAPAGWGGYTASPGYAAQMKGGMDALQSSAAARGGLMSGATMKASQQFGNDLAAQDYGNFYNRLAGVAGQGQAAAGNQAAAAANYGQNAGNALASIGNASAAGAIGQGNAWANGLNNITGTLGYMQGSNGTTANAFSTPWGAKGFWG